jgi:Ras-related protein Rab-5C
MDRTGADMGAFKVAFIGPCGCGKTSIINRFHEGEFTARVDPTVGASFVTHDVPTTQGVVSLNIWDTAGQERYKSLVPMYCRNASALIVVYDLSIKESFDEAKLWCERFRSVDGDLSNDVYYVGNKTDLPFDEALVDMARDYATSIGAQYFETSARTGEGITELFQKIAEALTAKQASEQALELQLTVRKPNPKGGCC